MSTTNPQNRLHRRPWFMPALRGTLWTVSGASAFVIAFVLTAEPFNDSVVALGFLAIPLLTVIAIGLTDANTEVPDRRSRYPLPFLSWMLGLWAACAGAGLLLGRAWLSVRGSNEDFDFAPASLLVVLGAALLLAGAGLLVTSALLRARKRTRAERARSIRLTGPRVPAVVTEVTRNRGDNVVKYWNVTLKFSDSQGTDRWHKLVHYSKVPVGSRHWIRYDPKNPGRRSTLSVEWDTRR